MAIAAICLSGVAAARQADPRFELVSLREVQTPSPRTTDSSAPAIRPGGRFVDPATNVWWLVARAYPEIKAQDRRIVGLPGWATSTYYAVSAAGSDEGAQLSPQQNDERVRLMIRSMLAERFGLRAHIELREEQVGIMIVDGRGILLEPVTPPVPPQVEGTVSGAMNDHGGRVIGRNATMKGLARSASVYLRHDVEDRTGDTRYYDFDIRWTNPSPGGTTGLGPEGIGLYLSMLKDHVGVTFSSSKTQVQYLVIDHIERPVTEK